MTIPYDVIFIFIKFVFKNRVQDASCRYKLPSVDEDVWDRKENGTDFEHLYGLYNISRGKSSRVQFFFFFGHYTVVEYSI